MAGEKTTPDVASLESRVRRLDKMRGELEEALQAARTDAEKSRLANELKQAEREWRDAELDLERVASIDGGE